MVTIAKTSSKSDAEAGSIRWNKDYQTIGYFRRCSEKFSKGWNRWLLPYKPNWKRRFEPLLLTFRKRSLTIILYNQFRQDIVEHLHRLLNPLKIFGIVQAIA